MAQMSRVEMEAVKYGPRTKREARNIPNLPQPASQTVARPEPPPAVAEDPARERAISTPSFPLPRAHTGNYALVQAKAERLRVRPVQEADLEELLLWGVPRIQQRYPRCTASGILPFLRTAIRENQFRFLRTDHAGALFQTVRTPWEPENVVFCHFVIDRQDAATRQNLGWEVIDLYEAGVEWAKALNAVSFRFDDDAFIDLEPVAKRIGAERSGRTYAKALR